MLKPVLGSLPRGGCVRGIPMPLALWLMNEGSGGIIKDLSGNGYDGTFVGNTAWSADALKFNSDGDYILLDSKIEFGVGSSWTLVFWANKRVISPNGIVCGEVGTNEDYIFLYSGNYVRYVNSVGTAQQWTELTDFSGLHQYVLVADNDTEKLYRDGVYIASASIVSSLIIDVLGAGFGSSNYDLDGKIWTFMIFDFPLTTQQIAQLYQDPFPWFKRDPSGLWVAAMAGAPPAGAPGAMTLNTGYWGPTI